MGGRKPAGLQPPPKTRPIVGAAAIPGAYSLHSLDDPLISRAGSLRVVLQVPVDALGIARCAVCKSRLDGNKCCRLVVIVRLHSKTKIAPPKLGHGP